MHQLLLGAAIPYLVAAIVYVVRGRRASPTMLLLAPLAMLAGALWAVVPDLPRLIGWQTLYNRLAADPRSDIFLWHYSIDRVETDSTWYQVVLVLLFVSLLGALVRELRLHEKG